MSCCASPEAEEMKHPRGPEESDRLYELLQKDPNCQSLLKKHLSEDRLDALKNIRTKLGGTLADCIRSGCENTDSSVGMYACEPDAYTAFALVMDEIIKSYHEVDSLQHPLPDFGDMGALDFDDLDPSGKMILSTRIRAGRNHENFPFPPLLTKDQRLNIEKKTVAVLKTLPGQLKGIYHPLPGMSKTTQQRLTQQHFLFNDCDRFLRAAGGYNHWPSGRGIFFNETKTFLVWVNEEDHLRLISMQKGGNLKDAYIRLVSAVKAMEKSGLTFATRPDLGYLTFCPSNLGTALRASVHVKIPSLAQSERLAELCEEFHLQARGIHGEHTESEDGVMDISNKRRLGLTEFEAIQEMRRGVEAILAEEIKLYKEKSNTDSILDELPGEVDGVEEPGVLESNQPDEEGQGVLEGNKQDEGIEGAGVEPEAETGLEAEAAEPDAAAKE